MTISNGKRLKNKSLRYSEYYDMMNEFDSLYEQSKAGKTFTDLMQIITSFDNIKLAYRNIKRNLGSITPGSDGWNIKHLENMNVEDFIRKVQNKMTWYKPKEVRRVEIPKPNGGIRPLGIPSIWDRIIQQCILQVLEPICEAKFHERSNGFRPNRSTENAMAQCYKMIQQQNLHYVVDIDIKGFFDNVNHSKLIKQIWTMGIRDKKLICIIKQMLKATIVLPNGEKFIPQKGTPQGGILSPLLSNIVLNELDWWISSQWETMPTHKKYAEQKRQNGSVSRCVAHRALRKSNLKEMYMVRYADDFKIFCRTRAEAEKVFIAVKNWLWERLKLNISEEKSKVVNLKRQYSEFLGFKMKAVKKRNSYAVFSHMSDKAIKRETEKLMEQVKKIQHPKDNKEEYRSISLFNSMVIGIHNYYQYATNVNLDCSKISRRIEILLNNRLWQRISNSNIHIESKFIREKYGKSKQLRFINDIPLIPIGYIKTKSPMYKKNSVNKYTKKGREEIHKSLGLCSEILHHLMRNPSFNRSVEYSDNRISLYVAQNGKCAVTKKRLDLDEIHCHHKIPLKLGGTDRYHNLIIIHKTVHKLIHATQKETITRLMEELNLTNTMLEKVNKLRLLVENFEI